MPSIRYPQFCALARAAELIGERWTLLIVRELLLGPKRFSDLKARLDGVSSSVLAERLSRLERDGLLRRDFLEPPAASTVYELTDDGRALEPVAFEMIRWGARYLVPRRPGDKIDPDWFRLALSAYASTAPTPARSFELRLREGEAEARVFVTGGPQGTTVATGGPSADVTITGEVEAVLGLMAGLVEPKEALRAGQLQAEGDLDALPLFPQLFDAQRQKEVHPNAT